MIDFNEMAARIQKLNPKERAALKEFYDLDSDHELVKFTTRLIESLNQALKGKRG